MRLLRNSVLGVLVLAAVALTPKAVLADDDGVPIKGTFAALSTLPSALNYCASGGLSRPRNFQDDRWQRRYPGGNGSRNHIW